MGNKQQTALRSNSGAATLQRFKHERTQFPGSVESYGWAVCKANKAGNIAPMPRHVYGPRGGREGLGDCAAQKAGCQVTVGEVTILVLTSKMSGNSVTHISNYTRPADG